MRESRHRGVSIKTTRSTPDDFHRTWRRAQCGALARQVVMPDRGCAMSLSSLTKSRAVAGVPLFSPHLDHPLSPLGQARGLRGASRGARPRAELAELVHDEGGEARGSEAEDGEGARVDEQRRRQRRAVVTFYRRRG